MLALLQSLPGAPPNPAPELSPGWNQQKPAGPGHATPHAQPAWMLRRFQSAGLLRPADLLEEAAQALPPGGVEQRDVGDAPQQVGAEVGVAVAVLPPGPQADAVGQGGLEALVLR